MTFILPNVVTKGDEGEGRWITIGGTKGEDGKRHGGSPVFIKNGRITKGHPSLTGRKISNLKDDSDVEHGTHRQQLNQSRQYAKASWHKQARKAGHDPEHLEGLANEIKQHHDAFASERKDVLQRARERARDLGGDLQRRGKDSYIGGKEDNQFGIDKVVATLHDEGYGHHFSPETGEHGSHEDQLRDMLSGGNPEPMDWHDAYKQAFDLMGDPSHKPKKKPAEDDFSFDFGANVIPKALIIKGRGFGSLAARVITSAIRGHFEESKHRRGQPGNRGQFASGGGGGSKPSATPRTPKAKPMAMPSGRQRNPKFGTKIPHPPSLPGKNTPSMPGTGHPPENIGNPKTESEARDHLIWLMGRASILRRQGQSGRPLSPKQQKELTLSVNLANRIHAQHFSKEAQAKKAEEEKTGKTTDAFGLPTVAERSKPAASAAAKPKTEVKPEPKPVEDIRRNTALDAFMAKPAEEKPKPKEGDLRHNTTLDEFMSRPSEAKPQANNGSIRPSNPLLDEIFNQSTPATPKTHTDSETAVDSERFPSKHNPDVTYGYEDDRNSDDRHFSRQHRKLQAEVESIRGQLKEAEAAQANVSSLRRQHDIASAKVDTLKQQHADAKARLEELKKQRKPRQKPKPKSLAFTLPSVVRKGMWEEGKHPRQHGGRFGSKPKPAEKPSAETIQAAEGASASVLEAWNRAADNSFKDEHFNAAVEMVDHLSDRDLYKLAKEVNVFEKVRGRTKDVVRQAVKESIRLRRGMARRSNY